MKRLLENDYKGHRFIINEMDLVRIVKDIRVLKCLTKSMDPEAHEKDEKKNPREIDLDTSGNEEHLPPYH